MALNATTMKNAMKIAIDAIDVNNGAISNDAVLNAICIAIVNEINSGFVTSVYNAHLHTGSATAPDGPISNTGAVTITG